LSSAAATRCTGARGAPLGGAGAPKKPETRPMPGPLSGDVYAVSRVEQRWTRGGRTDRPTATAVQCTGVPTSTRMQVGRFQRENSSTGGAPHEALCHTLPPGHSLPAAPLTPRSLARFPVAKPSPRASTPCSSARVPLCTLPTPPSGPFPSSLPARVFASLPRGAALPTTAHSRASQSGPSQRARARAGRRLLTARTKTCPQLPNQ